MRDYFYAEDGAAVYMLLAEQLGNRPELRGQAFNFANEKQVTVLELVQHILEVMGSSLEPEILNEATNEIQEQFLSAEKARKLLSWSPSYSLDEGLGRTVAWYRDFFSSP